jgi:hypothetical protein
MDRSIEYAMKKPEISTQTEKQGKIETSDKIESNGIEFIAF